MQVVIKTVLSYGYVYGKIKKLDKEKHNFNSSLDGKELLKDAIKKSLAELDKLSNDEKLMEYVTIQKMLLSDPALIKQTNLNIDSGLSLASALEKTFLDLTKELRNSNSLYLKARIHDFEDVFNRIGSNIGNNKRSSDADKYILYTDKLYPSFLIENKDNILGIIAHEGGYSSHSAIIARSYDIPYVLIDEKLDALNVIIDTRKNIIITSPTDLEIDSFNNDYKERTSYDKFAIEHPGFGFYANVAANSGIKKAMEYGFDGIGLYRTELIFMNLDRPYTLDEQLSIYSDAIKLAGGKEICFRTFDIGDDKKLSYLSCNKKSVDNYIQNKDIFETQIEALLKASTLGNIKIMFPMIDSIKEFMLLKNWVLDIAKKYNISPPKIGMMLECKNALENINDFKNVDFISIGTNDLSMSLYNINREEATNIDEYIDDLISKLKPVVEFCDSNNIFLSVCGEIASVKKYATMLYSIGIKNLSVTPSAIRMLNIIYNDFKK